MRLLISILSGSAALFFGIQWITIEGYQPIRMTFLFLCTFTFFGVSFYNYMKHTGEIE
jgi:hypothetical protein